MNQIKIGKFIAERRRKANLTQMQLAEKLGITDRAVSKWENGKGMPDSSLMLDLCAELQISVNELLCGEVIEMTNYNEKAEQQLLEMAKKEERQNKRLLNSMWLILITDVLFYAAVLLPSAKILGETFEFGVIAAVATVIFLVIGFTAMKIEVDTGYYECKKCHHKQVPSYKTVLWSVHIGTTRYLKCPKCGKKSWQKKVIRKD